MKRAKYFLYTSLSALGAGLTGSLVAVLLMEMLRLVAGIPTPVELFGDHILKLLSAGKFVQMLGTFAPHSKTTPLGLTLLGMIVLGTFLGILYAALTRVILPANGYWPIRREWITAATLAGLMILVGVILFWGELGQNFLGLPLGWAMLVTTLALLIDFGFYGLTLCLVYRALLPKQRDANNPRAAQNRRQMLVGAGVAALSLGSAAGSLAFLREYLNRYTAYDGTTAPTHNGITAPITPNSEHYVVTQNTIDPTPNIDVWRLEVTGLVGHAGSYTYEEVQRLPSTSRAVTLECIANGSATDGHLISTAIWQGVTLRTLLERHDGIQSSARHIAFSSVDGYRVSLPLQEVLAVDPFLAWRMNGAELPMRHGFPLRALIPGRYGEENPKWLTHIELTDHPLDGLYADQGWYNGPLHTMTRIDRPRGTLALGHTIEIGGIAFAGARGVQKVEVSIDSGRTWQEAILQPPLSPDSWVLWMWPWKPSLPGQYTLVARTTDGTGERQTVNKQGTVPSGSTGYPMVTIQVG